VINIQISNPFRGAGVVQVVYKNAAAIAFHSV